MASSTSATATGAEDLLSRIITFLTTDAQLVTDSQQWIVLRSHRDNILSASSSFAEQLGAQDMHLIESFRHDGRLLNTTSTGGAGAYIHAGVFTAGVSNITMQLKTTRDVVAVTLRAASNTGSQYTPTGFTLQHSDDGTTWTTATTVTGEPAWAQGERRTFSFTSAGAHIHWRFVVDTTAASSIVAWAEMLLEESDGTIANHFGSDVIFKAPGNSATDQIYTGIRTHSRTSAGWYDFLMGGFTGYDAAEKSVFLQPGALPAYGTTNPLSWPVVPLWDNSTPFWVAADGRSMRFSAKVSTSYEGGYLGFILPYATPSQYPYPLAVGGSLAVSDTSNRDTDFHYSFVSSKHGVFIGPGVEIRPGAEFYDAALYLRQSNGFWGYHGNRGTGSETVSGPSQNLNPPYAPITFDGYRFVWPHCMAGQTTTSRLPYQEAIGGGYILQPCILGQSQPSVEIFGELDGCFSVSGFNNAPENTMTVAAVNYTIFQNSYRTTSHEFWALRMD